MSINRTLWHLCVWVGIVLLAVIAWRATENGWVVAFAVVAGEAAFYFGNCRSRMNHADGR